MSVYIQDGNIGVKSPVDIFDFIAIKTKISFLFYGDGMFI